MLDLLGLGPQQRKPRRKQQNNPFDPFGLLEPETEQRSRPTFTAKEKEALFSQQKGKCNGCEQKLPMRNLTVDHIKPFSQGGTERLTNLQLLCNSCNSIKGDGTQAQLKKRLKEKGIIKAAPKAAKKPATTAKKAAPKTRRTASSRNDDPFKILFG